jgi:hypothetical protein
MGPPFDFPVCQDCGRKLSLVIPSEGKPYYRCACLGPWPSPKTLASETDQNFQEVD